jgi:hypothetical protein
VFEGSLVPPLFKVIRIITECCSYEKRNENAHTLAWEPYAGTGPLKI